MAVNVLWLGAAGLGSILLSVAHRQGLFQKHGVDVHLVPVPGTQVPELTTDNPFVFRSHRRRHTALRTKPGSGPPRRSLESKDSRRLRAV